MRVTSLVLIPLFCLAAVACDTNKKAPPLPPGANGQASAGAAGQLPPGHPPLDGEGGMAGMGGMMGGGAPAVSPLTWTVPSGWQETQPSSSMRLVQFQVADVDGKAIECKVFAGIGGGVDGNMQRWIGFFTTLDGAPIKDEAKISKSTSNGLQITTLDVSGIFSGGMAPAAAGDEPGSEPEPWRMLAAVVEGAPTPVQVQLAGPAGVMAGNVEKFHAFVKSLALK